MCESNSEAEDTFDRSCSSADNSSEDEIYELLTNLSYRESCFQGTQIFDEVALSQANSGFRIKLILGRSICISKLCASF